MNFLDNSSSSNARSNKSLETDAAIARFSTNFLASILDPADSAKFNSRVLASSAPVNFAKPFSFLVADPSSYSLNREW